MSYYQVAHFRNKPIVEVLQRAKFENFTGNDQECHLNIPDNLLRFHLFQLMQKFDVLIFERYGKEIIWLDDKNGQFIRGNGAKW